MLGFLLYMEKGVQCNDVVRRCIGGEETQCYDVRRHNIGEGEKKRNPLIARVQSRTGIKKCPDDVSGHFECCANCGRMVYRLLLLSAKSAM